MQIISNFKYGCKLFIDSLLTEGKGQNILADLNPVCIGDEFADILRVILCADWDGMMTYQSDNSCFCSHLFSSLILTLHMNMGIK